MLGVWAFTYALIHLSLYLTLDQLCYSLATCDWNGIWQDILKRKYIFMGQLAFVCMLLLAITSTAGWVRRLKKNWVRLHRLVYVAGDRRHHSFHLDSEVRLRGAFELGGSGSPRCSDSACTTQFVSADMAGAPRRVTA